MPIEWMSVEFDGKKEEYKSAGNISVWPHPRRVYSFLTAPDFCYDAITGHFSEDPLSSSTGTYGMTTDELVNYVDILGENTLYEEERKIMLEEGDRRYRTGHADLTSDPLEIDLETKTLIDEITCYILDPTACDPEFDFWLTADLILLMGSWLEDVFSGQVGMSPEDELEEEEEEELESEKEKCHRADNFPAAVSFETYNYKKGTILSSVDGAIEREIENPPVINTFSFYLGKIDDHYESYIPPYDTNHRFRFLKNIKLSYNDSGTNTEYVGDAAFVSLGDRGNVNAIDNITLYNKDKNIDVKYSEAGMVGIWPKTDKKINPTVEAQYLTNEDFHKYKLNGPFSSVIFDPKGNLYVFFEEEEEVHTGEYEVDEEEGIEEEIIIYSKNISVGISKDNGMTWKTHHHLIRLVNDDIATKPYAVADRFNSDFFLYFVLNNEFLCFKRITFDHFIEDDSFIYPKIQMDISGGPDAGLEDFTDFGKMIRKYPIEIIEGPCNPIDESCEEEEKSDCWWEEKGETANPDMISRIFEEINAEDNTSEGAYPRFIDRGTTNFLMSKTGFAAFRDDTLANKVFLFDEDGGVSIKVSNQITDWDFVLRSIYIHKDNPNSENEEENENEQEGEEYELLVKENAMDFMKYYKVKSYICNSWNRWKDIFQDDCSWTNACLGGEELDPWECKSPNPWWNDSSERWRIIDEYKNQTGWQFDRPDEEDEEDGFTEDDCEDILKNDFNNLNANVFYNEMQDGFIISFFLINKLFIRFFDNGVLKNIEDYIGEKENKDIEVSEIEQIINNQFYLTSDSPNKMIFIAGEEFTDKEKLEYSGKYFTPDGGGKEMVLLQSIIPGGTFTSSNYFKLYFFDEFNSLTESTLNPSQDIYY